MNKVVYRLTETIYAHNATDTFDHLVILRGVFLQVEKIDLPNDEVFLQTTSGHRCLCYMSLTQFAQLRQTDVLAVVLDEQSLEQS